MKSALALLLLVFLTSRAWGQNPQGACGTPAPTPAEYREMIRLVKSRGGARTAIGPLVYLPVKFHIIRKSDGTGNDANPTDINRAMYWLNEQMAPANLQFYLSASGINYIDDTNDYTDLSSKSGAFAQKRGVRNAINIFVFNELRPGVAGFAYFPGQSQFTNGIFLNATYLRSQKELIPHEMGHYFNLMHTHDDNQGLNAERADGTNCQTTGDLVCDTPADPYGLTGATNSECTYTGTVLDATGRLYTPDLRNIMSYWHTKWCQTDRLSAGQYERIYEGYGIRKFSSDYNFIEKPADLPAPSLRIEPTNSTMAALRWNSVNGASGYFIERADALGGPWRMIQGVGPDKTEYNDGGRSPERAQYYRMKASNALNYSAVMEWRALKTQQIAFENLPTQVYGAGPLTLTANSSAGLRVQFRVKAGPGEITGENQLKIIGAGTIRIEAFQVGTNEYASAFVEKTCTVDRATQQVTIESVAEKTFGDGEFELKARSNRDLPVEFVVASGPGTVTRAGRVRMTGAGTLRVRAFHPGTGNYLPADEHVNITVRKATQTLDFESVSNKTFGDGPIDLTARSSVGLTVGFSANGPAYVSGRSLTLTGAGAVSVTARQPGNENYLAASEITHTFQVAKAAQILTFEPLADRVFGQAPFVLTARSNAGLSPSYSVTSGPGQIENGNRLRMTGAGTIVITARQDGNENILPAESKSQTFRVEKATQQISFGPLPSRTYGDAPVTLSASINSALGVQFTVQGPATLLGSVLTLTGAGEVTITASQSGDGNHHAAVAVTQRFTVDKRRQVIAFPVLADRIYSPNLIPLEAKSNSARLLTYVASGPAQLDGTNLRLLRAGRVTVKVAQSGDENHYPADTVTRSFQVDRAPQTIATELPNLTVGTVLTNDLPGTSQTGLPLNYTLVGGPAALVGTRLTLTDYGRVTLTLNQGGDDRYLPAPEVRRSFCVNPAVPTIQIDPAYELTLVSSSPFRNQWFFNGDTLRGATNARYSVTRAGSYTVGVANPVAECASQVRSQRKEIVISAVDEAVVAGFEIFPNPATQLVRVKVRMQAGEKVPTLSLHDLLGRSIGHSWMPLQVTGVGTYETDLWVKNLAPGTYLLRVQTAGQGQTKRLVVR